MSQSSSVNPAGPPSISTAEVVRLLSSDPCAAEARSREILKAYPQNADAQLVLAAALRRQGKANEAASVLEPVVAYQQDSPFGQLELGLAFGQLGRHTAALDALAAAVDLSSNYVGAWCALSDQLAFFDDEPGLQPSDAESAAVLRDANVAIAAGKFAEAESLLVRCLELSPNWQLVRFRYAIVLLAQEKGNRALLAIEELIRRDASNPFYRELMASALSEVGDFQKAIEQYEALLADGRKRPGLWISYGRALRAIGRQEETVAAFHKSIEVLPEFAEGYRALATVKTIRLAPDFIDRLRELLARQGQLTVRRAQLHFALAKALEDAGENQEAFENYVRSQELQSTGIAGTGRGFRSFVGRLKAVFTAEFLHAREGRGCDNSDPIFVVGMPRSGSTLVQEILGAHSLIEGTGELRALQATVNRLSGEARQGFPQNLATLPANRLSAMGAEYLERTRPQRKKKLPHFVDKFPQNFIYAGLIQLILPNAKIVDVRRDPFDCCVSCFTNYFPEGPVWSHSLDDLGNYYAGYVELMEHFEHVLPGKVYRLTYEQLIEDPETEVRRLLEYLGLQYEERCLRYNENKQVIRTTSVEQARRPIYRSGLDSSRKFDPWLEPLRAALNSSGVTLIR